MRSCWFAPVTIILPIRPPLSRLRKPLLRTGPRGSGEFKEISWDEALETATEWLQDVRMRDPLRVQLVNGAQGGLTAANRVLFRFAGCAGGCFASDRRFDDG